PERPQSCRNVAETLKKGTLAATIVVSKDAWRKNKPESCCTWIFLTPKSCPLFAHAVRRPSRSGCRSGSDGRRRHERSLGGRPWPARRHETLLAAAAGAGRYLTRSMAMRALKVRSRSA